jgi:hypothetical protein
MDYSTGTMLDIRGTQQQGFENATPDTFAPLTFQQEWALNHWMPYSDPYVVPLAVRLRGPLDSEALRKSIQAVVHRHDSLRTRLVMVNEAIKQRVDQRVEYHLDVTTITDTSGRGIETATADIAYRLFWKKVGLSEPQLNVNLLRLSDLDHVLVVAIYHIITDGISAMLFFEELLTAYGDFIRGTPLSLPNVRLQYSTYAVSQRKGHPRWLEQHAQYWKTKLAGARPVMLPTDPDLESLEPFRASFVEISLGISMSSRLRRLAQSERSTIAITMISLYSILMACLSGQRDFVIPFVVSGRTSPDDMRMLGLLGEYLPLRMQIGEDESFTDFLKASTKELLAACEHLDGGRIGSDQPEFFNGTSFNWLPSDLSVRAPPGWMGRTDCPSIEPFRVSTDLAAGCRIPCSMFWSGSDGIRGTVFYRADRFGGRTMNRLSEDLRLICKNVVEEPSVRVSSLLSCNLRNTDG